MAFLVKPGSLRPCLYLKDKYAYSSLALVIGDRPIDIEAGQSTRGMATYLFDSMDPRLTAAYILN
ncbi:MAG: hypothetical protein ACLVJN_10695 [Streptococcus parasanguinis]